MLKTTLYIVRHGQTEWNVQKRMQGHKDSALTKLGESQAQWLYHSYIGVDMDFFIKHYPEEIFENGIQCRDMIRLSQDL
ncbi:histidine phosphatase family protein [Halalkalibacter kiskunsagensis]|uniref:Histidine phosphatase family protein n=1 Tax=Halalkalibacter kiskunsagensis TaxID=1548599 RepID=A0ABV6KKE6_9BACI